MATHFGSSTFGHRPLVRAKRPRHDLFVLRTLELWMATAGVLLCALGPLGAQVFLTSFEGLLLFSVGALFGLCALGIGLFRAVQHGEDNPKRARVALACAALGAIPVILMARGLWHSRGFENLDDASTNVRDPPAFHEAPKLAQNHGRDFTYDTAEGERIAKEHKELRPLVLEHRTVREAYDDALAAAHDLDSWTVTATSPDRHSFEATSTTRAFRFTDDVVVRVTAEKDGARVDVRSKAREPTGDYGNNAHRIVVFLNKLKKVVKHGGT